MHKVPYLDGIRGVAACIVVFHHFAAAFYPAAYLGLDLSRHSGLEATLLTSPLGLLIAGNFCVCIFFVVSGFVLSRGYFQKGTPRVLSSLALRRYFRLLPPVVFSCTVAWLLMHLGFFPVQETAAVTGSTRWLTQCWDFEPSFWKLLNESFFGVFFQGKASYNNVLWTMSYEFYGSLLIFSALALFGSLPRRRWIWLLMILLSFNTYFMAFFLGLLLCDLHVSKPSLFARLGPLVPLLLALFGLYLGAYPSFLDIQSPWYDYLPKGLGLFYAPLLYHVLGASFLIISLLCSPVLQTLFSRKVPLFLGGISFSLYAIHVIIIGSASSSLFLALHTTLSYNSAAAITLTFTFLSSILIAVGMKHTVEEIGLRASKAVEAFFMGGSR